MLAADETKREICFPSTTHFESRNGCNMSHLTREIQMTQSSSSVEGPRVLYAQDGLVMAQIDTVCIAFWRNKPTPDRFKIQKSYLDQIVREHPGEAAFLVVVEAGSEPPDEPERKAS